MQKVRIYRRSGGLAHSFRPFHMTADQMEAMRDQYPENRFVWLS